MLYLYAYIYIYIYVYVPLQPPIRRFTDTYTHIPLPTHCDTYTDTRPAVLGTTVAERSLVPTRKCGPSHVI